VLERRSRQGEGKVGLQIFRAWEEEKDPEIS